MPLSDLVNITITTQNPGVQAAGFGVPLILSHSASWTERTRTYATTAEVLADFAAYTPEYLAASACFAQSPSPAKIMIGRAANKPTQKYSISVAAVANSTAYKMRVAFSNGTSLASSDVNFTSDSSATNDEIVTGLQAAFDALALSGLTSSLQGSSGSKTLQIVADAAGTYFAVEVLDPTKLLLAQTHADPGVAADLTACAAESSAWYALVTLFNSSALVAAAAAWAETNEKLYIADTADTACATVADGSASDVLHALKAAAYARTGGFFHPRPAEFAAAAECGRFLPISPGGDNWRLKTLAGVTAGWGNGAQYTSTHQTNLVAKLGNYYTAITSDVSAIMGGGKVSANEYIDVVRGRDWYKNGLQVDLVNLLYQSEKVPYTDGGVALVENVVRAMNKRGVEAGVIAASPAPTVTVPKVSTVSGADKSARVLNNVRSTWTLAGALNKLNVTVAIAA